MFNRWSLFFIQLQYALEHFNYFTRSTSINRVDFLVNLLLRDRLMEKGEPLASLQHEVKHEAEAEHVAFKSSHSGLCFWCVVRGGALVPCMRLLGVRNLLGHSEVSQLKHPISEGDDVFRLDVSMHHFVPVQEVDSEAQLHEYLQDLILGQEVCLLPHKVPEVRLAELSDEAERLQVLLRRGTYEGLLEPEDEVVPHAHQQGHFALEVLGGFVAALV